MEEVSNCCGDEVLNENDGEGICAGCYEHCEVFEDDEQASGSCLVVCHNFNFMRGADMNVIQSESIKELATALCLAQAEMGGAVKESKNPFFKSSYADLTSVIKVVKEPFSNHGLSFVQLPVSGDQYVGVTTMLMHTSGEWLQSEYMLPMTKRDPQAAGSAITYARRYALQSLAGIPSVDDDGELGMFRNDAPANTGLDMSLEGLSGQPATEPKKRVNKAQMQKSIQGIVDGYDAGDNRAMAECFNELDPHEVDDIWSRLNAKQQDAVRNACNEINEGVAA